MNLLSQVAATIGSRAGENVASGALAYLLDNYESIRRAFIASVGVAAEVSLDEELRFVVQRHDGAIGGVTDVSGIGISGVEELIVEAKVGAGLHDGQVARYLARLRGPTPVLVILTPHARLRAVFGDAVRQVGATPLGDGLLAVQGPTRIVGLSWEAVNEAITAAASTDPDAVAEVAQVAGLYEYLEADAFIPFSGVDVARDNGRLWCSISRALYDTLGLLSTATSGDVNFTDHGKASGAFFGMWGTVNGLRAWFGVWPSSWAHYADTPFWLYFEGLDPVDCVKAQQALIDLHPDGRPSVWQVGVTGKRVAIYPPLSADAKAVANQMAESVVDAAQRLLAHGIRVTATAADGGDPPAEPEDLPEPPGPSDPGDVPALLDRTTGAGQSGLGGG